MSERITDARLRELTAAMPDRAGGTLIDTLLLRELAAEILAAREADARTLAAEAAARGAAFREREAAMLRAQVAARDEVLGDIAQTLGIDRASAPQRVADEAAELVEQCNEWTRRVTDARRMTRAALTTGLAECDALRAQVGALTAECERLWAIIDGRPVGPTSEEAVAHDGEWLYEMPGDGHCAIGGGENAAELARDAIANGSAGRWWPLDADGRPTAWPRVTP